MFFNSFATIPSHTQKIDKRTFNFVGASTRKNKTYIVLEENEKIVNKIISIYIYICPLSSSCGGDVKSVGYAWPTDCRKHKSTKMSRIYVWAYCIDASAAQVTHLKVASSSPAWVTLLSSSIRGWLAQRPQKTKITRFLFIATGIGWPLVQAMSVLLFLSSARRVCKSSTAGGWSRSSSETRTRNLAVSNLLAALH